MAYKELPPFEAVDRAISSLSLPFTPAKLQVDDAVDAVTKGRYAFLYDVGVGKTAVSTIAATALGSEYKIVICPPIIMLQWQQWLNQIGITDTCIYKGARRTVDMLDHHWVIMSHAIFRDSFEIIRARFAKRDVTLIVDECFPAGTKILAGSGKTREIQQFSVGDEVLTSAGPRKIARILKSLTRAFVTLRLSNGKRITCTPDHPIFTDLGWLAAKSCEGRRLLHSSSLSDVRAGVQEEAELADLCGQAGKPDRADLLKILRDETESDSLPGGVQTCRREAERKGSYRETGERCSEGAAHGSSPSTSICESERDQTEARNSGRERNRNDRFRKSPVAVPGTAGGSVEFSSESGCEARRLSDELQAGLRSPTTPDRAGSGRPIAQDDGEKSAGCKEGSQVGELRVDGVSYLERESPETVWNFEVEGCPHYFAEGVLVHNCQWLKNPASKLFRFVNQFVAPDRNVLLLTATPTSKPEDTYSYIKIKTPQIYRSFGHWQNLHVLDRDIFGTITAYQNLEQLADNFAINSVKRTKREVFGNVMEPIYQQMPYELDPKHYKLYVRLAEEQLLLLDNGDKIDATTAQRLRHALQQIVVNYGKFSGNPEDRSKAFDVIDQVIEEVDPMDKSKSKLVIWTYYVATSESVTAYLKQKFGDRAVVAAYGKVNSQKSIDAIMTDPEARILVAQPSSCGVGLNLQHVCSENLFIEMATVPMQIRQALGRTDRVGQKVRPTMRFAQAVKTIQVKLFNDLLKNDDLVTQVERTVSSLRAEIFGG